MRTKYCSHRLVRVLSNQAELQRQTGLLEKAASARDEAIGEAREASARAQRALCEGEELQRAVAATNHKLEIEDASRIELCAELAQLREEHKQLQVPVLRRVWKGCWEKTMRRWTPSTP